MAAKKLLVIDDERCLTEVLRHSLGKAGYDVITASDGAEGLELACRELPNLIVTDFQMPVMDGLQLAIELRLRPATANTPVIILTSRGHRLDRGELARTSVREIMPKPFSARQLRDAIERIFGGGAVTHAATNDAGPQPASGCQTSQAA